MSDAPNECGARCRTRRAFLGDAAFAAAGMLLLSACGDGQIGDATGPSVPVSGTVRLADYPALSTVGGVARIHGLSQPVAVIRVDVDVFRALSLVCPHQGTTVNIQSSGFRCPNHGSIFDKDGIRIAGLATSNLRPIAVAYDAAAGSLTFG